jgi:hypothetical protein
MHDGDATMGQEFNDEIPVGYGVQRIATGGVEVQQLSGAVAVDRVCGACGKEKYLTEILDPFCPKIYSS